MKRLTLISFILISFLVKSQNPNIMNLKSYWNTTGEDIWPTSFFYSVFVQSFYDSNKDGIGDIEGLTKKLDYLKDLGIEAIWLLPVHPSPTYHKYDIMDYYDIHPDYGSMNDFKTLVEEAHERNIRIIIDLVVNHTSDQHKWFKEALKGNEKYIDYYVWSNDKELINKEPNHWHKPIKAKSKKIRNKKYYGFFWHEMPDLNYDNPKVREEIKAIGKYWLQDIGIDGFRLDAIRFTYPEEEAELFECTLKVTDIF